jgi:hypothetical protein
MARGTPAMPQPATIFFYGFRPGGIRSGRETKVPQTKVPGDKTPGRVSANFVIFKSISGVLPCSSSRRADFPDKIQKENLLHKCR